MIKILDSGLTALGNITNVLDASRFEQLNGENTLDFNAVLDAKLNSLITENSIFEVDNDYFDVALLKKDANGDNTFTVEAQSEHVSYRLNRQEYNKEYFTKIGMPIDILSEILIGTDFTVGTVEFYNNTTYSAQEAKSRRQLLMEFVAYVGGEIEFNQFEISILVHRGTESYTPLIEGKNINVASKTINKREKDSYGAPVVSYTCTPVGLPNTNYNIGDDVAIIQSHLDIFANVRLLSINYNPYDILTMTLEFGNYKNDLSEHLYRIETDAVSKDAFYNGCRIGPEFGFEAVRNDKRARSYFKSDGMAFQSGDGNGNWTDRLYYEYDSELDETVLVFDGKLTVDALEAIKANIDVVVSDTIIVNNLYAKTGRIADLTVNHLLTGDFISGDEEIFYMDIEEDRCQFIQAFKTSDPLVQYTDSVGSLLYWESELQEYMTTDETEWPVMVPQYESSVVFSIKIEDHSDEVGSLRIPVMTFGRGDGFTDLSSKGRIYKDRNNFVVEYSKSTTGEKRYIKLSDTGVITDGESLPLINKHVRNSIIVNDISEATEAQVGDIIFVLDTSV